MKRIGFFAGSFDPFTLGHADIVARALKIFDEVVIGIGTHPTKKPFFTSEQRALQIETVYAQEPRVRVVSYSGMTIEAAKQCGAQLLIRGVRSTSDFEYEQSISQINDHLHGPMTVLLFGAQGLLHISSSMVRELLSWNLDVSDYVPSGMPLTFD